MNKRIKLKKGIMQKACDDSCFYHKYIVDHKWSINNVCIGCKHKAAMDEICKNHRKEKGVIDINL